MHGTTTPGTAPVRALRGSGAGPLDARPDDDGAAVPVHCLVVEDNPTNQLVVTLFLRKASAAPRRWPRLPCAATTSC